MEILVCISKTPDTTAKVAFKDGNTQYDEQGVQFIMNPFDEFYALVRGVELQEKLGGSVTVLNVGPASNDIVIRKALAIGADKAVRIDQEPKSALGVAKQIAAYLENNKYDIIFFGKETIDYNGSEVSAMVAEITDLPYVSNASHLDIDGEKVLMNRDIEGGVEKVETGMPCIVSASKGMAEQRIPNMRGIMMAKRKPLDVIPGIEAEDLVEVVSYTVPEDKKEVKLIDPENVEELVRLLSEEAKVI
jgi:electron transfer flavoprotein beta subunit